MYLGPTIPLGFGLVMMMMRMMVMMRMRRMMRMRMRSMRRIGEGG